MSDHRAAGWTVAVARRLTAQVIARDGRRCQIRLPDRCTEIATVADHIVPISKGGSATDLANLRAACEPCNSFLGRSLGGKVHHQRRRERRAQPHSRVW